MPLERRILSKRHLRRKRAANLSRMNSFATNDTLENDHISNSMHGSNFLLHNADQLQTCTITDSISNMEHIPFIFSPENEPSSSLHVEVKFNDADKYIHESEFDIKTRFNTDSETHQFSRMNSFQPIQTRSDANTSTDSYSEDHDKKTTFENEFRENLRKWVCDHNITHTATDQLLGLIRQRYPFLPQSAKTLLNTDRKVDLTTLENGKMCYIGITKELESRLKGGLNDSAVCAKTLTIDINIDGLPLFKSSSVNLWPILCRSYSLKDSSPFMVAVFCGKGKPKPLDGYLSEFIDEMKLLTQNGIHHGNETLRVQIGCFLCDAPARAMLKSIKGHTSTNGCERCCIKAVSAQRKLYYPTDNFNHPKRCDDDFVRAEFDTTHMKGISPLIRLLVKLVTQFPLDPMHLIYLGVLKRLLINYWIEGPRPYKLSKEILKFISTRIEELRAYVTSEFIRKPRSLDEIKRWKATELRFFLLYLGPIVLHDVLDKEKYKHFLLLHTAAYILSSESLISRHLADARKAIEKFVRISARLYGPHFVVYNVHSMLHLCDDVERYGKLQDFSCFPFEDYLGKLKRRVRAKKLPLQQVVNRISELSKLKKVEPMNSLPESDIPKGIKANGENAFECESLQTKRFKLATKSPDDIVEVNGKIYVIKSIICIDGTYKCTGTAFRYLRNLYHKPLESSKLGIFFAKSYAGTLTFLVDEISCKCLRFPFQDGFGIFPIVHHKDC